MKVYKVSYQLFDFPYYEIEKSSANVRANNKDHAKEKLIKALKINGHRLTNIISVEETNVTTNIMSDTQNGVKL